MPHVTEIIPCFPSHIQPLSNVLWSCHHHTRLLASLALCPIPQRGASAAVGNQASNPSHGFPSAFLIFIYKWTLSAPKTGRKLLASLKAMGHQWDLRESPQPVKVCGLRDPIVLWYKHKGWHSGSADTGALVQGGRSIPRPFCLWNNSLRSPI